MILLFRHPEERRIQSSRNVDSSYRTPEWLLFHPSDEFTFSEWRKHNESSSSSSIKRNPKYQESDFVIPCLSQSLSFFLGKRFLHTQEWQEEYYLVFPVDTRVDPVFVVFGRFDPDWVDHVVKGDGRIGSMIGREAAAVGISVISKSANQLCPA